MRSTLRKTRKIPIKITKPPSIVKMDNFGSLADLISILKAKISKNNKSI
jgi:hypothetical protein